MFVLVHGAWHGGWCWSRVAPLLCEAGYKVYTPTLTGLGERAHLSRPDIDLDTHITDVHMLLEAEELQEVVLVGHSYAGMVITGVADRAPQRIRRLVYLDAFVPENGKALIDYVAPEHAARQRAQGEKTGTVGPLSTTALGLTGQEDIDWVTRHQVDHPYRTMIQPLRVEHPEAIARLPKTFVDCHSATGSFNQFAHRIRGDASWQYLELPTGHDAMVIDPRATADVLLRCV